MFKMIVDLFCKHWCSDVPTRLAVCEFECKESICDGPVEGRCPKRKKLQNGSDEIRASANI